MTIRRFTVLSIAIALGLVALSEGKKHRHAVAKHEEDPNQYSSLVGLKAVLEDAAQEEEAVKGYGRWMNFAVVQDRVPFGDPERRGLEIAGSVLMFALITFSNMGGLSGAGSNIPIMLIFYGLAMPQCVPLSSFVAVCGTVFRFVYNFGKAHPNAPHRVVINYEVVEITMPCVFLGSFVGIKIGKMIGEIA